MKYFLDTEFIEGFHKPFLGKKRHFIDLISIGIVDEAGRSYYAISSEYKCDDASQWVKDNVITPMYISTVHGDARNYYDDDNFHIFYGKSNSQIAREIIEFVGSDSGPEFYGYFSDYDWVLFCSLFGTMMELPKGFPMYCIDLKQMLDESVRGFINQQSLMGHDAGNFEYNLKKMKELPFYPEQTNEHNALEDAKWNKNLHHFLTADK